MNASMSAKWPGWRKISVCLSCGFSPATNRPGVPYDVQWGIVVQGLRLASRKAAEFGVTLAVQNHHDIAIHPDATHWLIKEVNEPNCKAAFDAWSPALGGLTAGISKGRSQNGARRHLHDRGRLREAPARLRRHPGQLHAQRRRESRAVPVRRRLHRLQGVFRGLKRAATRVTWPTRCARCWKAAARSRTWTAPPGSSCRDLRR